MKAASELRNGNKTTDSYSLNATADNAPLTAVDDIVPILSIDWLTATPNESLRRGQ